MPITVAVVIRGLRTGAIGDPNEVGVAVSAVLAQLPRVVDPNVPAPDLAGFGHRLTELGALHEAINKQQRLDAMRLEELGERRAPTEREYKEAERLMQRVLDGERAQDMVRTWCTDNQAALVALLARVGADKPARSRQARRVCRSAHGAAFRRKPRNVSAAARPTATRAINPRRPIDAATHEPLGPDADAQWSSAEALGGGTRQPTRLNPTALSSCARKAAL